MHAGLFTGQRKLYVRGCDELCNTVLTFGIPFVGFIDYHLKQTRTFEQGYWYLSGGHGGLTPEVNYANIVDGVFHSASIAVSHEEFERLLDFENHPEIKTTDELIALGATFEEWSDEAC